MPEIRGLDVDQQRCCSWQDPQSGAGERLGYPCLEVRLHEERIIIVISEARLFSTREDDDPVDPAGGTGFLETPTPFLEMSGIELGQFFDGAFLGHSICSVTVFGCVFSLQVVNNRRRRCPPNKSKIYQQLWTDLPEAIFRHARL